MSTLLSSSVFISFIYNMIVIYYMEMRTRNYII